MMNLALYRIWRLLAACLLIVIVCSGCASVQHASSVQGAGPMGMPAGYGMLAMNIASNRNSVSTYLNKWEAVHIRNSASGQEIVLFNRMDYSATHSMFIDAIVPGTYTIEQVASVPGATLFESASVKGQFPSFTIKAGQLTDLDTLVYVREYYPYLTRAYRWGHVGAPIDLLAVLRKLPGQLAENLQNQPILGWDDDMLLRTRRAIFAKGMAHTMRTSANVRTKDGTTLFAESFGQIAVRSPEGRWRMLQAPTAMTVKVLFMQDDNTIIAGADDGILLSGHLDGGEWQQISLPVENGVIFSISTMPGSGDLFVLLAVRDRFVGLSMPKATPGKWVEEFNRPRPMFKIDPNDAGATLVRKDDSLEIISGGKGAPMESMLYTQSQQRWTFKTLGESTHFGRWAALGVEEVGRFAGIPLTGMYFTASNDHGVTWQKRGELNWSNGSLMFTSKNTGYVVRTDSNAAFVAENAELSLWRTDDAGMQWTQVGKLPGVHGMLVALGADAQLGYVSGNGLFYVSADGGSHWRLERKVP